MFTLTCSPLLARYLVTAALPGARDVLIHGATRSPRLTALRATSPAPSITAGLDVLVQLVMAAITTAPCVSCEDCHRSRLQHQAMQRRLSSLKRSIEHHAVKTTGMQRGTFGQMHIAARSSTGTLTSEEK